MKLLSNITIVIDGYNSNCWDEIIAIILSIIDGYNSNCWDEIITIIF